MALGDNVVGWAKGLLRPQVHRYFRWREAPRARDVSYGLDRLDRSLERWLDFDGGVFIEAGANDGVTCNNTLYFERHRGWTGLLIEPIPELADRCVRNRGSSTGVALCALGGPAEAGRIVPLTFCNLMSVVGGAVGDAAAEEAYVRLGQEAQQVLKPEPYTVYSPILTLSSLIDRFGLSRVDLLVLDVEGYERQALAGLDLSRHRPRFILVEALWHEAEIRALLEKDYDFIEELGRKDLLFRAKGERA